MESIRFKWTGLYGIETIGFKWNPLYGMDSIEFKYNSCMNFCIEYATLAQALINVRLKHY